MTTPSKERLEQLFILDNGKLINKVDRGRVKAGSEAGGHHFQGYRSVSIDGARYLVHRVIWKLSKGFDAKQVDHINGDKSDNRIENLRSVDSVGNSRNTKLFKNNSSGVSGVSWYKNYSSWESYIWVKNKKIRLGYYKDKFEAICARKSAELLYGFHANHGRAA